MRSNDDDFIGLAEVFKLFFAFELNHFQNLGFGAFCENAVIKRGADKVAEDAFCGIGAFLFGPLREAETKVRQSNLSASCKHIPGD